MSSEFLQLNHFFEMGPQTQGIAAKERKDRKKAGKGARFGVRVGPGVIHYQVPSPYRYPAPFLL
jgi:hypothetical protein